MNSQIDSIIDVAERFIGIKESPPSSNNVIFNTHYYGKEVSGSAYPWCMAFVWDVFRLCDISDLFYGGKKTASCATLLNYAKSNNQYVRPTDLQRGDIVLYKFGTSRESDHTGIVADVSPAGIVAIEGNTSIGNDSNGGEVMKRVRSYTNIVGGYRPNYEEEEMATIIRQIADAANISTDEVIKRLGVLCQFVNTKEDGWEKAGAEYLVKSGLLTTPRDGREPVEFGELGVMLERAGIRAK